jgi:hypothetical protein
MDHIYRTSSHFGDENPAKEFEFLNWLVDELREIDALFVDEMRVIPPSPKPPSLLRRTP